MHSQVSVPDGTNKANAIALIICSFLVLISQIVPAITLIRVRNLAAVTLIIGNSISIFWIFLNPLIWFNDNQATWWNGHGLCDIQVTIRTPWYTLLSSALCKLMMDLARAIDVDNPRLFESRAMRRRRIVFDVLFIFGIPFIQLFLHYLIQVQRYAIIAVYGCVDFLDLSWARIVIMSMWPIIYGLLGCLYSVVTIYRLHKHRGRLSKTLSQTGSGLDSRKFLKLFSMATAVIIIYLPVLGYFFYTNWPAPFYPYSFARTHTATWGAVLYLHIAKYPQFQYWSWSPIFLSFVLFCWYGFTNEAINNYRSGLVRIGFGKVWPSLKEPYRPHRSGRGSSGSNGSWLNKFDLLSKAVNYMDGTKKQASTKDVSQVVSQVSQSTQSDSNSLARKTIPLVTDNPDAISPIPSHSYDGKKSPQTLVQELERPSPVKTTPAPHPNMFSAFRTHLNIPFPLFASNSKAVSVPTTVVAQSADLEKQDHIIEEPPRACKTDNTVETRIWSGSVHETEEDDPNSPKMGTRAYRERQRREKENRKIKENEAMSQVVADNVRVELGLPIHSLGQDGIAVKQELVRKEESVGEASPSRS